MERIEKLIEQIGFILTSQPLSEYDIYYYNSYKIFFKIDSETLSLSNDKKTDLIFFDLDLNNQEEYNLIFNFLLNEFKYELRKQKINIFLK